jgi:hypothetical protein
VLSGRRCDIIVLHTHATEERSDDTVDSIREELELVFGHLRKYHVKILLGDFNARLGREDIFKRTSGNGCLHENSSDNCVRVAIFATSKHRVLNAAMFPRRNIHQY